MNTAAREIMEAARFTVSERHPYLSEVLFVMPLVEASGLGTLAVDARWRLYYDPETVLRWKAQEAERKKNGKSQGRGGPAAVVFHELGHIIREHFTRLRTQAEADPQGVNQAQDREINDDVLAAGWFLPDVPLMPSDVGMANGLTAEEYYRPAARRSQNGSCKDGEGVGHVPGCGGRCGGIAHNPTEWERENTSAREPGSALAPAGSTAPAAGSRSLPPGVDPMSQEVALLRVAQAIKEHAAAHGKGSVPGGMQAWASAKLLPAKIDWRRRLPALVRSAIASRCGGTDWTWRRPGRRSAWSAGLPGWPLAPSLYQPVPRVAIVLDTSGSMGCDGGSGDDRTAAEVALSEVLGVAQAVGAGVKVFATDCAVHAAAKVVSARDLEKVNKGGGGTSMVPGFDAAIKDRPAPGLVVIVTDGIMGADDWPSRADIAASRCRLLAVLVGGSKHKPPEHVPYLEAV